MFSSRRTVSVRGLWSLARCSLVMLLLAQAAGWPGSPAAWAQADLAVNHYRSADSYYRQGKYADALREFRESYRLSQKVDLLYNIGQVYERMGKLAEAIKTYGEYLNRSKRDEPALRSKIANLEATLHSTSVEILSPVEGATVVVDGKQVGNTPLSNAVKVTPGSHRIKVTKAGYAPFSAYVAVAAGSSVRVQADLERRSGTPQPATIATPTTPTTAPSGTGTAASSQKRGRSLWTWIALGGGTGLVALGLIAGSVAMNKAKDAQTSSDSTATTAKQLALTSDLALVAGVAALATGAVLFFLDRPTKNENEHAQRSSRMAIFPAVTPQGASVGALWRF